MARPKVYEEARTSTAVRLPASLHARLNLEAAERDVSVNLIILKAVEQYLDQSAPKSKAELAAERSRAGVGGYPSSDRQAKDFPAPPKGVAPGSKSVSKVEVVPRFKK